MSTTVTTTGPESGGITTIRSPSFRRNVSIPGALRGDRCRLHPQPSADPPSLHPCEQSAESPLLRRPSGKFRCRPFVELRIVVRPVLESGEKVRDSVSHGWLP
jgi:hypothetical protein